MDQINLFLENISDFIYVYIMIALLIACGLYFTIRMNFAQIRLFPDALRSLLEKNSSKKISPFQAVMLCTASKVGTANISGVAIAIALGGAGSIFWMWIMAIIGAASSMAEATLAQMYKKKSENGISYLGGPAYYIEKALGKRNLGKIFAGLFLFCFLFGFNALQANNMSSSFEYYIPNYFDSYWPWIIGICFASIIAVVSFGGMKRISFVSSYLVPIMASIYILVGVFIVVSNFNKLPFVFSEIFKSAFDMKAIFGGFTGSVMIIGIKRSLLSNEAGMGSAPNAAACAETSHPAKQGIAQILSVFIDTMLICTISAFIVLIYTVDNKFDVIGMPLVQRAINYHIGTVGIHFITASVITFAFSAIIGNFGICESNMLFLSKNSRFVRFIRVVSIFPIAFGCVAKPALAWNLADITMSTIAIINIVTIIILSNKYSLCLKDYLCQRKSGKNPVFNAPACGINDTYLWK